MRYVINPHDGRVLDMRHMLIVGNRPPAVGNLLEGFQCITVQASGMVLLKRGWISILHAIQCITEVD